LTSDYILEDYAPDFYIYVFIYLFTISNNMKGKNKKMHIPQIDAGKQIRPEAKAAKTK